MSRCLLHPPGPPPDPDVVAALAGIPTAVLSDELGRAGALRGLLPLQTLSEGQVFAGPALTVRTRPDDNLIIHKAADLAEPGEFVVIGAGGATDRALVGEILCSYLASKGVVAVAVEGFGRDVAVLRRFPMPLFARGFTHLGPSKEGSGEIRGALSVGGTAVRQGDYVVGDADGVVVVPHARAGGLVAAARRRMADEERMLADIAAGVLDRRWLDGAVTVEPVGEGPQDA